MNIFDFVVSEIFFYITDKIFEDEDSRIIAKVKVDGWNITHYVVAYNGKVYVGRELQFKDLDGNVADSELDSILTGIVDLCVEFRKTKYSTVSLEDLKDKQVVRRLLKETKL